jgi:RNA polymerase sigma factor (sigma-70 family)
LEASALRAPARFARLTSTPALLKLRSDEQLVSLLRSGSHDAFHAIYERYGQRLFAYVRQMLGPGSRQDAEDVLQDVFARTYTMLRSDDREINLRPWLYRVAHNRCIDHLRRPAPATAELVETSAKALHDPFEEVRRREDLQRLVADISRLPDQQKSALLLRELNGLSYRELAEALDVTVPAVKSLLVRARMELVETAEARDAACTGVREELALAGDGQTARPSPRVRRHVRDCAGCRDYQAGIRGMRRSFAALSPVAVAGPLAVVAKLAGFGGSSGGASAGGTGLAGGISGGGLAAGTAGKIAAVVSTAAITAGGAVEIERRVGERAKETPSAERRAADGAVPDAAVPAALGTSGVSGDEPIRERGVPSAGAGRDSDRSAAGREENRGRGGERKDATGPERANAPAAGAERPADRDRAGDGQRLAGGTPATDGAVAVPTRPDGPGVGSPTMPPPSSAESPTARVDAPDPPPAQVEKRPAAPEVATPVVPERRDAPPVVVPAPPVEVPAAPGVNGNGNGNGNAHGHGNGVGNNNGKIKPDKAVGPKPGRGPKADVGL